MNRISSNLAVLPMPAHMPGWAKDLTVATQAVMDAQYLHGPGGLDNFYDQADGWIQTQTVRRANSADPKNYRPDPFSMAIPRRQFVDFDADGTMGSDWIAADPNIHMPELAAWVEPSTAPPAPLFGGTHAPDTSSGVSTQILAAIMAKLVSIESRLSAMGK